jgi:hypothetical protein
MPYVIVDTNCLMRDYLLIEATVQTFLRGCQRCDITVCFPDVVIDELVGNYGKDTTRLTNEHRSVTRKLQRIGIKVEATDFDTKKETNDYRTHIRQMMDHYDVTLTPYPEVSPKMPVGHPILARNPSRSQERASKTSWYSSR